MDAFTQRYRGRIEGVLSTFDQLVVSGTLPDIGHVQAMTRELHRRGLGIWDFHEFAQEQADRLRTGIEAIAGSQGLQVEFLPKGTVPSDAAIQESRTEGGDDPMLLRAATTIEPCKSYRPWRGKPSGKTELKPRDASSIHYHLQLVEPELGLCRLRIPGLVPFPLGLELRGHRWLARRLDREGVAYTLTDEGFQWIRDLVRAQRLAAELSPELLHRRLDALARGYFPLGEDFPSGRHWSLSRVGLATEFFFRDPGELAATYPDLVQAASQVIRAEDLARFVGRPAPAPGTGKLAVELSHRDVGGALALRRGPVTIRISLRSGRILRIETVTDDVTYLRAWRSTVGPDGTRQGKVAALRRSIYSLPSVRRVLEESNLRVLDFLAGVTAAGKQRGARPGHASREA